MLFTLAEFRQRVEHDLDALVRDLQILTCRHTLEEEQAWRSSLPKVSRALTAESMQSFDVFVGAKGNIEVEYRLPGIGSWADLIILGKHHQTPAAVIIELKDWLTQGDLPGPIEGLVLRHGYTADHPSDQVGGYVDFCRNFHSAVQKRRALVHGCVLFTKDKHYHTYLLPPNDKLVERFPCFSTEGNDVPARFSKFFEDRLTQPDRAFAEEFERGVYQQRRGFIQQIGEEILHPESTRFVLLDNQRTAFNVVRARVAERVVKTKPKKAVVVVIGPPGSGKSVVAARVWASLVTDQHFPLGNAVIVTTSASQKSNWRFLFREAAGVAAAQGTIIPATSFTPVTNPAFTQLAAEFPMAFGPEAAWQDNMTMLRSLRPEFRSGARDNEFLVSIVDEAHALINPEHSEGRGPFGFELKLGPQAYHIIRSSTVSVFLLDPDQDFRDRENTTIADIKKWAQELDVDTFDEINLGGIQFRCAGSTEYVDWVDRFLSLAGDGSFYTSSEPTPVESGNSPAKIDRFTPFEIELFSNPFDLEESLRERVRQGYTARLAATYSRKWKTEKVSLPHLLQPEQMDFYEHIEDNNAVRFWSKIWNYVPQGNDYTHFIQAPPGSKMSADCLCEVGCPYAIRGFDFDYIGLLWLGDLKWRHDRWIVDPRQVFETGMRRRRSAAQAEANLNGPAHAALSRSVRKAYRILLTRMMKGIFIWCEDLETRNHLRLQLAHGP